MSKRLILCADGTWNHPEQVRGDDPSPTNVIKIARSLLPQDETGIEQIVWYQWGLGTRSRIDRFLGGFFGSGLEENVEAAYHFLAVNYAEGDEIFLFGFSRGAFIVRSLTGMIGNVGLLRKDSIDLLDEAYERYRSRSRRDRPRSPATEAFRQAHAREVEIRFLGVWDTVGARGIPLRALNVWNRFRHGFHDVTLPRIVRNAFQALAIDERRGLFSPALWEMKGSGPVPGQRIEQTWFPGVHADVGGGYADSGLADGALLWMAERAAECGLAFDDRALSVVADPDFRGTLHRSRKGYHRLTFQRVREMGTAYPETESVHASALARMEAPELDYAPENLLEYLRERAGSGPDAPLEVS